MIYHIGGSALTRLAALYHLSASRCAPQVTHACAMEALRGEGTTHSAQAPSRTAGEWASAQALGE